MNDSIKERIASMINKEIQDTFDNIYETFSELKIRISKLEQYARIQSDNNQKITSLLVYILNDEEAKALLEKHKEEAKQDKKQQYYNFEEALIFMKEGKKIKRKSWHPEYWISKDNMSNIMNADILANDWIIK